MTRPEKLPLWANDPALTTADVLEPPEDFKLSGHRGDAPPVREWENWRAGLVSQWLEHLQHALVPYASIEELVADENLPAGALAVVDWGQDSFAELWSLTSADLGGSTPTAVECDGLRTFVITADFKLRAFNSQTGALLWGPTNVDSPHMAADGKRLYYFDVLGGIKAVDPATGTSQGTGSIAGAQMAICANRQGVYVVNNSGHIYSLAPNDLAPIWVNTSTWSGLTVRDLVIYGDELAAVADGGVQLHFAGIASGGSRGSLSLSGNGRALAFDGQGRLVVGTDDDIYLATTSKPGTRKRARSLSLDDVYFASPPGTRARGVSLAGGYLAVATNAPSGLDWLACVQAPGAGERLHAGPVWEDNSGGEDFVVALDPLRLFAGGAVDKVKSGKVMVAYALPRKAVTLRKSDLSGTAAGAFYGVVEEG